MGGTAGSDFDSDMTFSTSATVATAQTYSGPTTISNNAVVTSGINNALPTNTMLNLRETTGNTTGSFNLAGFTQTLAGIAAWGSGTENAITSTASGAQLYVNVASGTDSYSGELIGSLSMFKEGAGTLDLTGTGNNYSGATTVDAGTLQLGASGALPTATSLALGSGATFDLQSYSQQITSLTSASSTASVTGTGGTLTVAPTVAGTSEFAGGLHGSIQLAFNGVSGSGELLSGTSDYSGTTNVNSGALIVNGALAGAGGAVTVNSGAGNPGVLSGVGSIGRNVTIAGDGTLSHNAVLAPGSSLPDVATPNNTHVAGLLDIAGSLTVSGTYLWDLVSVGTASGATGVAGTDYDQVALGGHALNLVTVSGQAPVIELNLAGGAVPTATDFWKATEIWNVVTGLTGTPGGGSSFAIDYAQSNSWSSLGAFSVGYSGGSEQLVWTPTAVPEPGTLLLGTLAALGLGARGWRRRCVLKK
ncbi:MAG TPA: autotransporter-associated beta strand repeat-containing protein [Pirellulales bacterium]|nr:autotransporter-associated beta strand repeat-containing protein [Pirellulales bacterium]